MKMNETLSPRTALTCPNWTRPLTRFELAVRLIRQRGLTFLSHPRRNGQLLKTLALPPLPTGHYPLPHSPPYALSDSSFTIVILRPSNSINPFFCNLARARETTSRTDPIRAATC